MVRNRPFKFIVHLSYDGHFAFSGQLLLLSDVLISAGHICQIRVLRFLHGHGRFDVLSAHFHFRLLVRFLRHPRSLAPTHLRTTAGPRSHRLL